MATEKLKMAKPAKPQPEYLTQQPPTSANFEALERYISGLEAERARTAPGPESSISRRALGDTGLALVKGTMAVPQAAVGLADLATGGRVGRALEEGVDVGGVRLGFRPKEAGAALDEMMTPEAQAAQRRVQEAQGFLETTLAAIQNPSVIVNSAAESLPLMGGGGVIGRALMKMAPAIGSVGAGAAGEGITTMGSQAESIRQETRDGLLTGDQALLAAGSGAATGMLSLLGGRIAQRLGIADVDTLLTGKADQQMTKGFLRRVLEGAVSEGPLEELPQSVQEQVAQNLALGKPLGEGVPQAAVLGALTGGLVGAGGNLLAGSPASQIRQPPRPPEEPPPEETAAARAQRDADRPPEPAGEPQPGDITTPSGTPFKTMRAAMRAQAGAGPGAELVPVAGGLVVRPAAAQGVEQGVTPPQPQQEPVQPTLAGVEPAVQPPKAPPADPLPDDILNKDGKPFTNRGAAANEMRRRGDGFTIREVVGGFAVRRLDDALAGKAPTATTTEAPLIDAAAHEAASSPMNDRPEPTDAQKEAGNYKVGRVRISGMEVSIETPKGAERSSKADAPQPWKVTMPAHYGYIRGTEGADGDHVDLFIGDKGDNGRFWVINQHHAGEPTRFDEHKVVTGVDSAAEAVAVYKGSFADGFGDKVFTSISAEHNADEIKALLPKLKKPRPVKASPPESPKPAADAGQRQETAAPAASSATTAQRWDGMPAADRERALLAAGWKSGSDGTKAMQGKAWDGMTPSQQARIARVLEQQRENAPAQQEPAEPPPAAKTEGATSEGETDGQEEGRRQEGLLNREPAPKVDEAPAPATKAEDEKPSDAKAKTAAAARQAIDERIEVLRGMVKDDESAATRALRKRIEVLQALRRCVG